MQRLKRFWRKGTQATAIAMVGVIIFGLSGPAYATDTVLADNNDDVIIKADTDNAGAATTGTTVVYGSSTKENFTVQVQGGNTIVSNSDRTIIQATGGNNFTYVDTAETVISNVNDVKIISNNDGGAAGDITLQKINGTTVVVGTSSVTMDNQLVVSSGGESLTGGLNNNGGGITNAGDVSGVATLTATTGNITTVNATTVGATTGNITTVNATTVGATTGNITTVNSTTVSNSGNVGTATLSTSGLATLNSVSVTNGATVGSTFNVLGNTTLGDTIGDSTTINGTLGVSGLTTLNGGATITGTTNINTTGTAGTWIGNTNAATGVMLSGGNGNVTIANNDVSMGVTGGGGVGLTNTTAVIGVSGGGGLAANTTQVTVAYGSNNVTVNAAGVSVSGNTGVTGTLDVTGATSLDSTLDVDGATTLNSTLDVDGATTLNSTLDVYGAADLHNTLHVAGASTLDNTLAVDSNGVAANVNGATGYMNVTNGGTVNMGVAGGGGFAGTATTASIGVASGPSFVADATPAGVTGMAATMSSGGIGQVSAYSESQTIAPDTTINNLLDGKTYTTRVDGNMYVDGNVYINGTLDYVSSSSATTTVSTVNDTGTSILVDATQGTVGQMQMISKGTDGATESMAALTLTNGIGNTHGVEVYEDRTVLSGGTESTTLTLDDNGATFANTVTGGPARVHGVADGVAPYDAVNVRQLENVSKKSYAGIASVAALAAIPNPAPGKRFSLGVGYGNYMSQNAVALGLKASVTENISFTAGAGYCAERFTSSAGVGYSW